MMALGSVRNQYLDGGYGLDCAQDTAAVMDKAVKAILDACYQTAVEVLKENREDMDKVVAYLLEKETITGGEMVAIIEGRDPALVEDAYASTRKSEKAFRPSRPEQIDPPAKHIHIISQEIKAPPSPDDASEGEPSPEEKPEEESSRDNGDPEEQKTDSPQEQAGPQPPEEKPL